MAQKAGWEVLLINNFRSFLYWILVAVLSTLLMLNRYLIYAWPDILALPLLFFIPLGMTLKGCSLKRDKIISVSSPWIFNLVFIMMAYIHNGDFPSAFSSQNLGYWLIPGILNPGIMGIRYFAHPSRWVWRYGMILLAPSFLMFLGMILREYVEERIKWLEKRDQKRK